MSNGWWDKFLRRNQTLRLHVGDSTAGVRLDAVNEKNMDNYFILLKDTYNQFGFAANPETIFNMDETSMPLCPRPPKVVARKGQKKVRYQTSGQKSQVTILACGSETSQIIPPFIIFAGKQISSSWTQDEVSGSCFTVSLIPTLLLLSLQSRNVQSHYESIRSGSITIVYSCNQILDYTFFCNCNTKL